MLTMLVQPYQHYQLLVSLSLQSSHMCPYSEVSAALLSFPNYALNFVRIQIGTYLLRSSMSTLEFS